MSLLRRSILHSGPLVTLSVVRCLHPRGGPGKEEETSGSSIDLPLSGVFVRHLAGKRIVASAASVLFYNTGEVQRVSHPAGAGDCCLSLGLSGDALGDAFGIPRSEERDVPFARTHLPADPPWAAALHRLRRRLEAGVAGCLEAEETAFDLVQRLAEVLSGGARPARRPRGPRGLTHERVEAAKLLVAGDPGRAWSLADLSAAVGGSAFHLSRTFTREVGLPLHRWAVRQRLLLSLERVGDGAERLVDVALDLGFASHAHFTAAFARTFGLSPSAFRASARRAVLADLRKNVKA